MHLLAYLAYGMASGSELLALTSAVLQPLQTADPRDQDTMKGNNALYGYSLLLWFLLPPTPTLLYTCT